MPSDLISPEFLRCVDMDEQVENESPTEHWPVSGIIADPSTIVEAFAMNDPSSRGHQPPLVPHSDLLLFQNEGDSMDNNYLDRRFTSLWLPLLVFALGCGAEYKGPERGAMQGQVTLNGEPLKHGTISFVPTAGTEGPSAGSSIENGNYSIPESKGPVVGTYRIEISSFQETGKKIPAGSPFPPGTMIDETKEAIPPKYNSASELEGDVVAGENTFNFELQSQ